ncbi:MAG: hypothetical protein H0X40_08130 [Chthoniobacterales bacterium]|nr:hypothetical protein [Chthoniobacterales bacterium]
MKNTLHTHNLSKRHQSEVRDGRNAARAFAIAPQFQANNFTGGCGKPVKFETAFRDISKDYFAEEAPRGFAVEASLFAGLVAMALFPIVNSAQAVATLVHHLGLL